MNEHADDIARLFAREADLPASSEFADQVKRAIRRERRYAALLAVSGTAVLIGVIALAVFFIPVRSLYPIQFAHDFLTSMSGMLVCATGALALTVWLGFADA